jgi:undecaprenyl pyrophosphate synthase
MMNRALTFLFASLLLLSQGCGDQAEGPAASNEAQDQKQWEVVQKVIDGNRQFADLLTSITDVETARAAAPKLQATVDSLKAAGEKMETFAEPTEAMKKRMDEEFTPAMAEAQNRITAQMERLEQLPEAMAVIDPILASM